MNASRHIVFAVAAFNLLPSTASACLLELKSCVSADGEVIEQIFHRDNVFIFQSPIADNDEVTVAFCPSKASLRVRDTNGGYIRNARITDVLIPAIESTNTFTIGDIAKGIRANGLQVNRRQLADGHCVCDLPQIPDFPGCPEYGQSTIQDEEQTIKVAGATQ